MCRPLSPFEALLAASLASSKEGEAAQGRECCAPSCEDTSELDSADDTAMGGDFGEGVGESSGAESRGSDNPSASSKRCRPKVGTDAQIQLCYECSMSELGLRHSGRDDEDYL